MHTSILKSKVQSENSFAAHGIPTVSTQNEIKDLAQQTLQTSLSLFSDPILWKRVDHKNEITVYEAPGRNKLGGVCFKVVGTFNVPNNVQSLKSVVQFLWDADLHTKKCWEEELQSQETIEAIEENLRVERRTYSYKPLKTREFVSLLSRSSLGKWQGSNCEVLFGKSINIPSVPLKTNLVRGNVVLAATLVREEGDKILVERIIQIDPQGHIPHSLLHLGRKKLFTSFENLREAVQHAVTSLAVTHASLPFEDVQLDSKATIKAELHLPASFHEQAGPRTTQELVNTRNQIARESQHLNKELEEVQQGPQSTAVPSNEKMPLTSDLSEQLVH